MSTGAPILQSSRRLQSIILGGLMVYPFILGGILFGANLNRPDLITGIFLATLIVSWWAAAMVNEHWCDKPSTPPDPTHTQPELPF